MTKPEQSEVFYLDPLRITVKEGLDRYRKDLGDIEEFGQALKKIGQIQPIVINREFELIVGGRRLAACILAGIQIKVIYEDIVNPKKMRLWELEENIRRKDFTPAEYALAVKDFHELMQEEYGETVSGRKGGHTLDNTAKILGKTKGTVLNELEMAEMIKAFPELKQAKKKSEIKKAAKGLFKLNETMKGLSKYEELSLKKQEIYQVHNIDAVEYMKGLKDNCKDILLTDPLYGIGADELAIGLGGKTNNPLVSSGYKITDNVKEAAYLLKVLAEESFRFTTPNAHGYVFVGPEYFWTIRQLFMSVGWRVYVKPLIWIKYSSGQCNVPTAWPSSCYEMLMYIRKDASKIIKEGQPDWIECTPVLSDNKLHSYEKPVTLLLNLLERVCIPGQELCDPFMGCGSSIIAGLEMKLICEGVDISLEAYSTAVKRIEEYLEGKNENGLSE